MKEIIEHLRKMASGEAKPGYRKAGVCREMAVKFTFTITGEACKDWPKWSGCEVYPVPHPSMSSQDAFMKSFDLWANDEYGDNRRDLCRHLADWLESNYTESEVTE